jgi:hemolysin III
MVSHIAGGAFGVVTTVLCVVAAALHENVYGVVGGAVFGATMILLYTISAVYHGLKPTLKAKKVLQVIDHCMIYVLIAGTYTPISLSLVREYDAVLGWTIFGVVWAAAHWASPLRTTCTSIDFLDGRYWAWAGGIVATRGSFSRCLRPWGLWLLFGGGVAYTLGAVLYGLGKKVRYMHTAFHGFVVAGSICHALFIIFCVL